MPYRFRQHRDVPAGIRRAIVERVAGLLHDVEALVETRGALVGAVKDPDIRREGDTVRERLIAQRASLAGRFETYWQAWRTESE